MQIITLRVVLATYTALAFEGCAVHRPYPQSWEPLPPPPATDCRHFEGDYSDRGEIPGSPTHASLTQQLFGPNSAWRRATRVGFSLPRTEVLEITVWQEKSPLFTRTLTGEAGTFTCEAGQVVVRDRRGVSGPGVAGFESVTITLSLTDTHVVARVKDIGVGFAAIVPVAGTTTSWYRFPRLHQ